MRRLEERRKEAIRAAIRGVAAGERADVVKLKSGDGYRLRVGAWRVIFDIEEDTLVVLRVSPRGRAY